MFGYKVRRGPVLRGEVPPPLGELGAGIGQTMPKLLQNQQGLQITSTGWAIGVPNGRFSMRISRLKGRIRPNKIVDGSKIAYPRGAKWPRRYQTMGT